MTDHNIKKRLIIITVIISLLVLLNSCLTKDIKAPEVNYIQNNIVISPNNDGIQDDLVLDVNISDDSYIKYWRLDVFDLDGNVVKTFSSGGDLDELQKKTFFKKESVDIPEKISWDGKDNNGNILPDGKFTFKFIAMDSKKNITPGNTKEGIIYLDTEKPEIKAELEDVIFSPNNDGNKDTLKIEIDIIREQVKDQPFIMAAGSGIDTVGIGKKQDENKDNEQKWYIDILNDKGEVVRTYMFNEKGKKTIDLDGLDNEGNKLPDGIYTIKLHSTDEGGNYYEEIKGNITIDTKVTEISSEVLDKYFSPNNDNSKDTIDFKFTISEMQGIESWNFKIINNNNEDIRNFSGDNTPGLNISWDGKDNDGEYSAEGEYKGVLEVTYNNGNKPVSETGIFNIDVTSPEAKITLAPEVFSPDGNNIQDEVIILQNTSKEELWKASIFDENGEIIKSYSWNGQAPKKLEWDGKNDQNTLSNDGFYFYQLESTDLAGNSYKSLRYKTKLYTKDTPIFITATIDNFSPNGDGVLDDQIFDIRVNDTEGSAVDKWEINIVNSKEDIVYNKAESGELPGNITWAGVSGEGNTVLDDEYFAELLVYFVAGTVSSSKTRTFKIDTMPPEIEISVSPKLFSPDNDGFNDELTIGTVSNDFSGIKSWKLMILNPKGNKEFISFEGLGRPAAEIKWDGKSSEGDLVESVEDYPLKVVSEDNAGNILELDYNPIQIDILVIKLSDGRLKVRISNIQFKPNSEKMVSSSKNKDILDLLGKALRKYRQYDITIEGHANKFRNGLDENRAKELSKQRAQTVAYELTKRGINKNRMIIIGKGFDIPIIPLKPNMTKEEREEMAINRRVEFYLEKK